MGELIFSKPVKLLRGPKDGHQFHGRGGTHHGVDYPSERKEGGELARASERGRVVRAAYNRKTETRRRAYGLVVVIDHTPYAEDISHSYPPSGQCIDPGCLDKDTYIPEQRFIYTLYAHLKEVHVWPGLIVEKGDRVGEVGSTGMSTGPHLHFEIIETRVRMPWANGTDFNGAMGVGSGIGRKNPMFYYGRKIEVEGTVEPELKRCELGPAPRPMGWSRTGGIEPVVKDEVKVFDPFVKKKPVFEQFIRGGRGDSGSGQRSGRR